MTDLSKRILGFAGVAFAFAGVAFGQIATCGNPISAGNFIRTEGKTEKLADLYITCTNNSGVAVPAGVTVAAGGAIGPPPPTDITVYSNIPITSKNLQTVAAATQYTEAMVGVYSVNGVLSAAGAIITPVQGVVLNGTQLTFIGVPTPALGAAAGQTYTLAITNIRVDASSISTTTPVPVNVNVFMNTAVGATPVIGATVLSNVTLAFAQPGLSAATIPTSGALNLANGTICGGASGAAGGGTSVFFNLQFGEAFPNSFKTQTAANAILGAAESNNSETGYQPAAFPNFGAVGSNVAVAGTRLQINYAGIPAGVAVYVPQVVAEDAGFGPGGVLTLTASATGAFSASTPATTDTNVPAGYFKLTVSGSTAVAVYEVTGNNPGATDKFTVLTTFKVGSNVVAPSAVGAPITAQVTFAPIAAASGTIPNFAVGAASTPQNGSVFSLCTTTMIFPFLSNQSGFDTGMTIANTSTDNLKSGGGSSVPASAGTCAVTFFGTNAPAAAVTTPSIATGTVYAATLSSLAPGFTGYAIANCQFLFAHAFAYISYNLTQTNGVSMGYLALNVGTGRATPTSAGPESLGN